jgi:hypothetical protein
MRWQAGYEIAILEKQPHVKIAACAPIWRRVTLPIRRKHRKNNDLNKFFDWLMDCITP